MKGKGWGVFSAIMLAVIFSFSSGQAEPSKAAKKKLSVPQKVDAQACYGCHEQIKDLMGLGKHAARVNCAVCHLETSGHLDDISKKPVTRLDLENCGSCHKDQYRTLMEVNVKSRAKVEKATTTSRSPTFDKLMMPHGFTKEHDEPRSHAFMVIDHMIVDRAYGGRFQLKDWTHIDKKGKVWDVVVDTGKELPQTAKAANTVCLSCKTSDHVLKWGYMGDPLPGAVLKRDLNPAAIEMAKNHIQNPMGCIHCHDPHATKPRVIQSPLIQAAVDRGEGTYPYDPKKSQEVTIQKITFQRDGKDFRAIGILNKPDSNVLCAQCHVEYNCNPGIDTRTGGAVGMDDRRTNYYPWVNVFDLQKRYQSIGFKDFRHALTGAALTKIQHPEVETYWGSKHERAGVECKHCHMPKMKQKGKGIHLSRPAQRPVHAQGHLRALPSQVDRRAGGIPGGCRPELHPRQDAQGRILAGGTDFRFCPGEGRRGGRRGPQRSPERARPGPHSMGMVDGGKQRRLPQPGDGPPVPGRIDQRFSKGDRNS